MNVIDLHLIPTMGVSSVWKSSEFDGKYKWQLERLTSVAFQLKTKMLEEAVDLSDFPQLTTETILHSYVFNSMPYLPPFPVFVCRLPDGNT